MSPRSSPRTIDAPPLREILVAGHRIMVPKAAPGLHLAATPIGNLGDITLRALETLAGSDVICCEDTRVTHKLLERYGITVPLSPYHEHNAVAARPKILARLAQGDAVTLVSDAGTPLVSDPGFKLVREATAAGFAVHALPGPSSVLAALTVAALPTDRFYFEGFLPAKDGARRNRIAELARIDVTLVLFESGARLAASLRDLAEILGRRDIAICREMTKLHEDIRRMPLAEAAARADELETRGEFVLVIGPPSADASRMSETELDDLLRAQLAHGSVKDAVAAAVELSGYPRREVYARALALAQEGKNEGKDE
ncbi:ribosomal RNA small subunit methyltransferase I [Afipia carboxidovorans OM5]|uniref:Ribosomal RNA small subunit methyltransferase I n=1 Tax=Afipia carboxidovorans (strain ATCC 49405 / DSM 1227 / KCTC 32145 / OM5) TaxID=504832 RepID=F8BRF0_AFIC5|nr:16S rRNA (cytidine(1402)-2'-O)-methyltransferase [Afipia carboxidovorans]AEI01280.1 ribosomal RNA small subunit methyltransferase I [Afipia carboxidovorans OM4]AEI04854.1 ribosomal RNA small subunit methyltransferase I [Afipia carboxidovorans OM5]